MPRLLIAPLFLIAAGGAALPTRLLAQADSAAVVRPVLAPAALQADFDVLRNALEEAHGGFDRFTPRAELNRRLDMYRARLERPLTTLEFAGVLAEAIAELRDGHARLELDSVTSSAFASALVLPLRVQVEGDRLIVLSNDSPDTTITPGMEVVQINGRSAAVIMNTLLPKVSADGFIETGKRTRLAREFAGLYWINVEQTNSYQITARHAAGRMVISTVKGILERDRRNVANPVNVPLTESLSRLDGPRGTVALQLNEVPAVARLRIRAFAGQGFAASLDSAFLVIREQNVKGLVLDLRGNGGGVDEYGALLVSYFLDRPFRYFDHIHVTTIAPSFATWPARTFENMRAGTEPDPRGGFRVTTRLHPGVGEQQPATQPFLGKLVVLIDGGSFSTTADVAAQLRSRGRAVFVGEETAGTYEGNTSALNALIILPNSRLRTKVMMYGYWNAVTAQASPGRGTVPEHIVPRRVSDLLRGVDPALQRALDLARPK